MPEIVAIPADLNHVLNNSNSLQEAADHYGVSRHVLYRWRKKAEETDTSYLEVSPDQPFEDAIWEALEILQEHYERDNTEIHDVDIKLSDNKPIMVTWLSDLHIGHVSCDMKKLRHDLGLLKSTEGVYAILGGDLSDNVVTAVTNRGMHNEQLSPIRIQKAVVDKLSEFLGKDKVLAMVLGNHDEWSISNDDFDFIAYLSKKIGCSYMGAWGYVNLMLGSEEYRFLVAHQFRMNSSFNKTHAAKRLMDLSGDADVVFTGHKHEIAAESTRNRDERRFFAQAGSYLKSSRYGRRLGFKNATSEMPAAIIFPDKHKVIGVYDSFSFEEGIGYLTWLREQYA